LCLHVYGAAPLRSAAMTPDIGTPSAEMPKVSEYVAAAPRTAARAPLERICVKSVNRIVVIPAAEVSRLEAEDNYVRIWADRPYLHKDTLTHLLAALDPEVFVRIHRSHAVNVRCVRELRPQLHGEYVIILADGTAVTSGRSYRREIQLVFGLD
jgi:two-component system, LytTR family, response regulator